MKVVYVDYKYHYGKKDLGLNYIAIDGFVSSFKELGHEVSPFFYDELVGDLEELEKELVIFCEKNQPDLVFFVLAHDLFSAEVISKLSDKFTTINFFGDDHWRFEKFTSKLANSFTYCVTTDLLSIKKYKEIGFENLIVSQWAALDINKSVVNNYEYKYDVSFVGGKSPYREWFVNYLSRNGIEVKCFGVGWEAGPVSAIDMAMIFQETKINLNISNSCSYDLRFLISNPLSFVRQLRSAKTSSQVKARNFEIPALNGFQLSDFVPFIDRYLKVGEEIVCFNDVKESIDLINYYLQFEIERENIKAASHSRVTKEHFYINRVEEILKKIDS